VKLSLPDSPRGWHGGPGTTDPTRYRFGSVALYELIALAYNVEYFQVSSKTALDRDRYDVIANVPEGATKEQFRVMMQNLLAERFRLKSHKETREFPAYELVVAKSGTKLGTQPEPSAGEGFPDLAPAKPDMRTTYTNQRGQSVALTRARQMPVAEIVSLVRRAVDAPVVDRTGLTGNYDFTLAFSRQMGSATEGVPEVAIAPSVFTAVQQQLGLQLVSKRLPFEVIVVDFFDRVPAEN
jgi:uncharacterized protein (TIGR03435 family)